MALPPESLTQPWTVSPFATPIEKTLRILKKEVLGLCSTKEGLTDFDLQHVCEEWKVRAPLFYSFFMTSSFNKRTKASSWFGSIAVAGSVLRKQRSKKKDASWKISLTKWETFECIYLLSLYFYTELTEQTPFAIRTKWWHLVKQKLTSDSLAWIRVKTI